MITIDIKTALIYLLLIAAIVLVGYFIVVARNLVTTIKEMNKILEDISVISGVAAEKAVQIDQMVGDVQSTVADMTQVLRGEQGKLEALSNFVNAIASLAGMFKSEKLKKKAKKKNINKY